MVRKNNSRVISDFIQGLDEIMGRDISYNDGLKAASALAENLGFRKTIIPKEDGGGVDFEGHGYKASVFQPYPDIDRIYYEW